MSTQEALARARLLGTDTAPEDIGALRARVEARLEELRGGSEDGRAYRLATEIEALLDHLGELDEPGRCLLRGAAEYFILDDDFEPGLLDDAEVVRSVRLELGLTEVPDLLADDPPPDDSYDGGPNDR